MKKIVLFALLALVLCVSAQAAPEKAGFAASDCIEWGTGGGIAGQWSSTRVYADGRVETRAGFGQAPKVSHIKPAEAARLLQSAVDAGLFNLHSDRAIGADMIYRVIEASIRGRKISVSKHEGSAYPEWERVWTLLRLPAAHP